MWKTGALFVSCCAVTAADPICPLQVAQLHHELNLKDELLQFYTNAAEESEDESGSSPTWAFHPHHPLIRPSFLLTSTSSERASGLCFFSVSTDRKNKAEAASGGFVSDTLQRKLKDLEEENLSLRSEVTLARAHKDEQEVIVGMQLLSFLILPVCF